MIEQMRVLEAAQPLWAWGLDLLPEDRPGRYLVGAVAGSLLLHLLVVAALLLTGWLHNPLIVTRGDLLFVEPTPAQNDEPAPAGHPAPPAAPERVKAPPAPVPPPSAPARAAIAPASRTAAVAPPTPPAPAPRAAPPSNPAAPPPPPAAEEPAYEGHNAQEPVPRTARAQPEAEAPPRAPSVSGETGLASVPRPAPTFNSPIKGSGGGSYYQGSQGGVVGQPVPLDTPDPNYRDYMQKVRQRIYANWRFPSEPYPREISGRLVIEFLIGKDGKLLKAEIVQPSGEHLLDISAMSAVRLADRYPPLPDAMQRDVLPVVAIFTVKTRASQSSTFQLLQ
jgi:periplasmic protein TonB